MKLAVLSSHPIQYYTPFFREIARRMDLHVFFAHNPSASEQAQAGFGTAFGWDVDLLSGYSHSFLSNLAKSPGLDRFSGCDTPEIETRLREGKFDALLVMGWWLKAFLQATIAARRLAIPVLVRGDSHLETPRHKLTLFAKQMAYPLALRAFNAALYVGQRSRNYYLHYKYPRERMFYSPHCVDNDWFRARATADASAELRAGLKVSDDKNLILFAGKLLPLKRPLDVIEAVATLADPRTHVLIAGSGELAADLDVRAKARNVTLHQLGFRNQSEMPACYAAAKVLVLPSESETWGLVANEALASGCPIIMSDAVGAAPDLAVDNDVGRTFPVGNTSSLARAISAVLKRPPSAAAIAQRAATHSPRAAVDGVIAAVDFVSRCRHFHRPRRVTQTPGGIGKVWE